MPGIREKLPCQDPSAGPKAQHEVRQILLSAYYVSSPLQGWARQACSLTDLRVWGKQTVTTDVIKCGLNEDAYRGARG